MGGLQKGLCYPPVQGRACSHGETIRLVVRVRNVGEEAPLCGTRKVNLQYEARIWKLFDGTNQTRPHP